MIQVLISRTILYLANLAAFVLGGVAIVAVDLDGEFACVDEGGGFGGLVVGEGFGGKEVEGAGGRPFQQALQHGDGVTQ